MKSFKPVLFCDFDGVLCHDRYWRSLSPDEHEKVQKLLFSEDPTLVNSWMRGKYTAEEVNKIVAEKTGISYEKLWPVFVEDCKTMRVPQEALEKLNTLRDKYIVVLMTGNMDSFTRFTVPALSLHNYFDHISNSFYEGIFKTDNEGEIYLKYAKQYGAPIQNCIVFDDSKNVYKVFKELGGTPYLVTKDEGLMDQLEKLSA